MTTTLLDRVPVDEITERAKQVRFGHTVLTVIAAVFFGIGWVVAKAWLSLAWCAVAVKVGWLEARATPPAGHQRPGAPS